MTLSVRPWERRRVEQDGHYRVGLDEIELDAIELLALAAITGEGRARVGAKGWSGGAWSSRRAQGVLHSFSHRHPCSDTNGPVCLNTMHNE